MSSKDSRKATPHPAAPPVRATEGADTPRGVPVSLSFVLFLTGLVVAATVVVTVPPARMFVWDLWIHQIQPACVALWNTISFGGIR